MIFVSFSFNQLSCSLVCFCRFYFSIIVRNCNACVEKISIQIIRLVFFKPKNTYLSYRMCNGICFVKKWKISTFLVRFKYTLAELAQLFGISEAINNSPIRQQNQRRQSTMKSDPVCIPSFNRNALNFLSGLCVFNFGFVTL